MEFVAIQSKQCVWKGQYPTTGITVARQLFCQDTRHIWHRWGFKQGGGMSPQSPAQHQKRYPHPTKAHGLVSRPCTYSISRNNFQSWAVASITRQKYVCLRFPELLSLAFGCICSRKTSFTQTRCETGINTWLEWMAGNRPKSCKERQQICRIYTLSVTPSR